LDCRASDNELSEESSELSLDDKRLLESVRLVMEASARERRIVSGETVGVSCTVTGGNMTRIVLFCVEFELDEGLLVALPEEAESRERAREKNRSSKRLPSD
jgi:hypothetical protein